MVNQLESYWVEANPPCYTLDRMADKSENALDKAEAVARRILERLGSKLDSRLATSGTPALGARQISDLTRRVESAIESNLRDAETGAARLAPNRFRVLFTYEETSNLPAEYMEAVGKELTSTVREYINNRRYETSGPIDVEVARDVFANAIVVKVDFTDDPERSSKDVTRGLAGETAQTSPKPVATVTLEEADGRAHRIALASGQPACIGRAAGNAVRIDDPSISRIHCSLAARASGEVVIADLGSANRTHVNETPLTPNEARKLTEGDVIRLGDVALSVAGIS
ncbi:MAG TPA: FhaA domain-containing protein [Blastocatellia bacterium]|nr:FhaA domain-containing protein [Blastocatellia bacterium]